MTIARFLSRQCAVLVAFIAVANAQPNMTDGGDDMMNMTDGAATEEPTITIDVIVDYPSIEEILTEEPTLSLLLSAAGVAMLGGLDDGGNYTMFAPNNDAFNEVDSDLTAKLLTSNYILHLQALLAFHVTQSTEDRVESSDLMDGMELSMLTGETVTIGVSDGTVTVSTETNVTAEVVDPDNLASNGNVHIVDSVLVPKFLATDLLTLAGELENYKIIVELLDLSGAAQFIQPGQDFTIFAPTDAAFEELGADTLDSLKNNTGELALALANHVLLGVFPSVGLSDGQVVTAAGGTLLTFSVGESIMVNGATVVDPNILARDGIVHGIDTVLLAETAPPPPVVPTDPGTTTSPTFSDAPSPSVAPSQAGAPVMPPTATIEPTPAPVMQAPPPTPATVTPPVTPPTSPPSGVASVSCLLVGIVSVVLAVAMA